MAAQATSLVHRFLQEVLGECDLALAGRLLAPDFVNHSPAPGVTADREGFQRWLGMVCGAFSQRRVDMTRTVSDGDLVAVRWTFHGTHTGVLMTPLGPIPPTSMSVAMSGFILARVHDGAVTELWINEDEFGLLLQLGAIVRRAQP